MKVLIVKCRASVVYDRVVVPPLGALYLSAFLKAAGCTVKVVHLDAQDMTEEDLGPVLLEYRPDVVGLSAITAEGKSMHAAAAAARRALPSALIAAGGPHPTGYPEDCLADPNIDVVVRGEGELTFLELVRRFEADLPLEGTDGTVVRSGGKVVSGPDRPFIEDLDSLPFPDWAAVDLRGYARFVPQAPVHFGTPYATLLTSRGCPFRCVFCHNIHGKKFRAHSPERVLAELRSLRERYGVSDVEIIDDIFNWDRARTERILSGAADSGAGFRFYLANGVRADILDRAAIDLFARAGVVFLCAGIETADPARQAATRKHVDLQKLRAVLDYSVEKGIFTHALFMIGFPGETVPEVLRTLRFACALKAHTVLFSFVCAYQGSELGDKLGDVNKLVRAGNDMSSAMSAKNFVNCSPISGWKLVLLRRAANAVFFLNPARLLRIWRNLPGRSPALLRLMAKKLVTRTLVLR